MCVWFAPLIMMGVSAVAGGLSAYSSAQGKNKEADYNAQVAEQNAELARMDSAFAREQAQRNAAERQKQTHLLIGEQRAKMGASGALVNSGSFLDVQADTAALGARDAQSLLHEGDMEAWRSEQRARGYDSSRIQLIESKTNPIAAGVLAGISSGIQSGASMYEKGMFRKPGTAKNK